MQKHPKSPVILAVLLITVGAGWMLTAKGYGPGINWVWTLAIGVTGLLIFVLSGGIDKVSIVLGPFFLVCSILSIMRQTGNLDVDMELPSLVILIGVLLLLAQLPAVPIPKWFVPLPGEKSGQGKE